MVYLVSLVPPAPPSARPSDSMTQLPDSAIHLLEIEARQDDAMRQLDELEQRVERALREFTASVAPASLPRAPAVELLPGTGKVAA